MKIDKVKQDPPGQIGHEPKGKALAKGKEASGGPTQAAGPGQTGVPAAAPIATAGNPVSAEALEAVSDALARVVETLNKLGAPAQAPTAAAPAPAPAPAPTLAAAPAPTPVPAPTASGTAPAPAPNAALAELLANRPTFNTTFSGTLSRPVGSTAPHAGSAQLSNATPGTGFDVSTLQSLRNAPDAATAQAGLEAVLGALGYGLTGSEKAAFSAIGQVQQPLLGTPFDYRTFLPY